MQIKCLLYNNNNSLPFITWNILIYLFHSMYINQVFKMHTTEIKFANSKIVKKKGKKNSQKYSKQN